MKKLLLSFAVFLVGGFFIILLARFFAPTQEYTVNGWVNIRCPVSSFSVLPSSSQSTLVTKFSVENIPVTDRAVVSCINLNFYLAIIIIYFSVLLILAISLYFYISSLLYKKTKIKKSNFIALVVLLFPVFMWVLSCILFILHVLINMIYSSVLF